MEGSKQAYVTRHQYFKCYTVTQCIVILTGGNNFDKTMFIFLAQQKDGTNNMDTSASSLTTRY